MVRPLTFAGTFFLLALAASPSPAANPPAPGFDAAGSDPEAIELADRVMDRMGGREAWDSARYLTWNFFGRRRHLWDRATGRLRLEGTDRESGEPYVVLMNLDTKDGRAWRAGAQVDDPEELASLLDGAEAAWINDSYWLLMPYKLKDSGVTLRYLGESSTEDGRAAEVLELTFREVGRTPQNKYHVYVARDSGLVEQWDYYADASDPEPTIRGPWSDWRPYGRILLSGDRGGREITEIAVFDQLPDALFASPEPIDWKKLLAE